MGHFNGKIGNAHVPCHVMVVGGHPNHIFGISDPNLPIYYITFMGLQWRLRGVYMEHLPFEVVFGRKFSNSRQKRAPKQRFFGNNGIKC